LADRQFPLKAAAPDLVAQPLDLLGGGVHADAGGAGRLERAEHEAAEAAADVDEALALRQPDLATDVVDLVALRRLERRGALGPVAAGVHLQRIVEPQAVERFAEPVVRARVDPGLRGAAIGPAPLEQVVLDL